MRLLVVLPTYNEALNLRQMVTELLALPVPTDVLVVDDASPDGTSDEALALGREHPGRIQLLRRTGKLGLGSAYRDGLARALTWGTHSWIALMDCDFSHPPPALAAMVEAASRADMVVGSRYVPGGSVSGWGFHRRWLSRNANRLARAWLGLPVSDYTSGFMLMRRTALESMRVSRGSCEGYAATIELKCMAFASQARIAEVPIVFRDRERGKSKLDLRIVLEAIRRLTDLKRRLGEWAREDGSHAARTTQTRDERQKSPQAERGGHHPAAQLHHGREGGVEPGQPPAADVDQQAAG